MRVGRSWLLVLLILTTHQWHQLFTFIVSSSTVGDFVPLNEHSVQARKKVDDLKSAMLSYHEKSNKMAHWEQDCIQRSRERDVLNLGMKEE